MRQERAEAKDKETDKDKGLKNLFSVTKCIIELVASYAAAQLDHRKSMVKSHLSEILSLSPCTLLPSREASSIIIISPRLRC